MIANFSKRVDVSTAEGIGLSRKQLTWFFFSRLLAITILFATAIYFQLRTGSGEPLWSLRWLSVLVGLSCAQTFLVPILLKKPSRYRLIIQAQIAWDLLFAILFVCFTGGVDSPFAFLFILIILSAGVFLHRRETLVVAAASSILYGSLLDLQYYGYLPSLRFYADSVHTSGNAVLYAVVTNVTAYFLTALLSGLLAERLRYSQQELKRKEIDFEELDSLNRTIVSSLSSGLMTINAQGRIRVFNPGAERITGLRLADVYNHDIREIFPGITVYDEEFILLSRGEGEYLCRDGTQLTLGFATSLIQAGDRDVLGLLISFQDLTRLKEVEGLLRRNDRLAAVGQLAAGLAHEIRNPLASISGSVQLLLENVQGSEEDRRLMRIVVKEAERLNRLLGDFLRFARPAPVQIDSVELSELLDELISVATSDPRCSAITLQRDYDTPVWVRCDRGQLQQAVWNLVVNAIEVVLPGIGTVCVGLDLNRQVLYVEDNGPGISEESSKNIFTPFYTTKEGGTGLGLATVHAIMEAHGGSITVAHSPMGGARFELHLPSPWTVPSLS